ncbi:MAG TPA: sulfatase-like hydrolase/transferase [Polyangiaceae bacterium]|nr:sulfatase-like hydrolase/transferase [Polyangiaceae bacterium]
MSDKEARQDAPAGSRDSNAPDGWRWALAALGACSWLAVVETALATDLLLDSLPPWSVYVALPLALAGNLLPYCALAALVLFLVGTCYRWLDGRRARRWWFLLGALLLGAPYSLYIAHFSFSGPQMLDHPLRPVFLAGVSLVVCAASVGASLIAVWVPTSKRLRSALAAGLMALSVACLVTSSLVLPNEYEALHAFLMVWAVLCALLGFGQALAEVAPPRRSRWLAITAVAIVWSAGAAVFLARAESVAWVIWAGTPGSRYLTQRVELDISDDAEVMELDRVPDRWRKNQGFSKRRARRSNEPAPNIVVFSVDNLTPDHVGAYGYERHPTTPNIDRLAEHGLRFDRAYSYYPQTRIFMSSMLFGRKAPAFGRHRPPRTYQQESLTGMLKQRSYHVLVEGVFEITASREFRPADYAIDTWLRRATAAEIRKANTLPHIPQEERFAQLEDHLEQAKRTGQPVFIWMHFLQPHRFRGRFVNSPDYDFGNGWEDLYDSAVAGTDRWLPKIEEMLAQHLGNQRPTYWLVQSDHGAGLRQGERESGKNLMEDHIHVPLIIAGPGVKRGRVGVPVDSCIDVAATILDLAGLEPPASYEGASLVPLFESPELASELEERAIYLEQAAWRGAIYKNYKLIQYRNAISVFDLASDPLERQNLAADHAELIARLQPALPRRAEEIAAGYAKRPKRRSGGASRKEKEKEEEEQDNTEP